jgi:hypothetical protein
MSGNPEWFPLIAVRLRRGGCSPSGICDLLKCLSEQHLAAKGIVAAGVNPTANAMWERGGGFSGFIDRFFGAMLES